MPLFHVQDSDRPLWVVAADWNHAITAWKSVIVKENPDTPLEETEGPQGVQYVCDDNELVVDGSLNGSPLEITVDV